jgi:hypothetical protein
VTPTTAGPIDVSRVAILIPALNEELRIREVVEGALRHCPNVIVVCQAKLIIICQ